MVQGAEQCDPPGVDPTCAANCRYAMYCGNAIIEAGEECDLGLAGNVGAYGQMGCMASCQRSHYCGDGILDAGEQCDPGLSGSPSCTSSCLMTLP